MPEVALAPDQEPDALQEVALAELQDNVIEDPTAMDELVEVREAEAVGKAAGADPPPPPPQEIRTEDITNNLRWFCIFNLEII